MNSLRIIEKYVKPDSELYNYLVIHSTRVAEKAVEIADGLNGQVVDIEFIRQASMLHDIGVIFADAPSIGCYGTESYIRHGVLGASVLEKEGLIKHARVCECHVGVGLSIEDIREAQLPLPLRDMLPETLEEKIVCIADKFYSKSSKYLQNPKPLDIIREDILRHGQSHLERLNKLLIELNIHG